MARIYAKFDAGWVNELDNDYFDRHTIGFNSTTGSMLRTGLLTSRSILSSASYAVIPKKFQDGQLGVIIPRNIITTDSIKFLSWSAIYTSSLTSPPAPGIIIPADYRTRPTASILSTMDGIASQSSTSASISWSVYFSASTAVRYVIDQIVDTNTSASTPYTRTGDFTASFGDSSRASRTLHSVWHDEPVTYFAWDDFTPGPGLTCSINTSGNSPLTIQVSIVTSSRVYANDVNPLGYVGFYVTLDGGTGGPYILNVLANGTHAPIGNYIQIGTSYAGQNGPAGSTWTWNGSNQLQWDITVAAGNWVIDADSEFYDVTTKQSGSRGVTTTQNVTVV